MKKLIFLSISLFFSYSIFSQSFNTNEFTWFGIDYTQCYYLGPIDFPSISDLESKIEAWNDLVIQEREKYIDKTLKGKKVSFAIESVKARNEAINVKSRLTEDNAKIMHLNPDQIPGIISSYNIDADLSGTGLVLIAESYDRLGVQGNYYVVFFDIASKKVYSHERMSGKSGGIGLRNYWATTYYNVLKNIGKKYK